MKINYESTSAERMYDEFFKELIIQARLKLQEILKDNKQNGISWVAIPKNSDNRYLKVATLKRVLRDKFNHTLILKSDINMKKMKNDKPLTQKEWEEIFEKILAYTAQLIIAVFLCAVVIYSIF